MNAFNLIGRTSSISRDLRLDSTVRANHLWVDLRLGEGIRAVYAAKCFYLGKGVEETRHLLDGRGFGELDDVRELADLNGSERKETVLKTQR